MGKEAIRQAFLKSVTGKPAEMQEILNKELHSRAARRVAEEKKAVARRIFADKDGK